ncbi:hypothetical protein BDN71DRAFT_1429871 [Pleurotus eryngii]|uniref:Uncharacterized protein n=1 Tax=Pleurotus eryngii TaxID=5323 RepID=A0A9P6D9Y0_PLEER|nr:hypothetical protein BDN71DRAFT_1429871 [Pleurotus eryngii]
MKHPISMGDLQKGERYDNMDYLYFSSIQNGSPTDLVIFYDIASSYLSELVKEYPKALNITYLVPKFHLYAHHTSCQINYSFNLTQGVRRMDGESPECGWAAMNPVASSTKEMGPESQRDTLDDHFSDYNWHKVQEAVKMQTEHLIHKWEASKLKLNPFEATVTVVSTVKVRLQLAKEDVQAIARGEALETHDTVSPSVLIVQGLKLEEQQDQLQINCLANIQELYMPGVGLWWHSKDPSDRPPESINLFLPSDALLVSH